jgi:hypothetical protein
LLVFIDESGYALPTDSSPWSTLAAVCLPESASRDLTKRLHAKVKYVYPNLDPDTYEVKAADLLNRHQFERSPARRTLVSEVAQLLETLPIAVFSIRCPRPSLAPCWPKLHVDPPNRLLVERVELYMRAGGNRTFAKLVFDETGLANDALRSRSLRKFFHATAEGACCGHVLDVPFFVASDITPGIQLADLMAGAIRHYQILRDQGSTFTSEWEKAIQRIEQVAYKSTHDFPVGTETYYGLYTMPDRYYTQPPGLRPF